MAVLPTEEYRYTAAEYALAEASVKQNSLFSVPIPMYLGTGIEDSGVWSSCILYQALGTVLVITNVTFRVTLKTINFLLLNELKTQQNLAHLFYRDCAPQNSNNFFRCSRKIEVIVV